jgi:hypothetical protein
VNSNLIDLVTDGICKSLDTSIYHQKESPLSLHAFRPILRLSLFQGSGSFLIPSLSFLRRRESRNVLLTKLDARLRGHDGKNTPTPQLFIKLRKASTFNGTDAFKIQFLHLRNKKMTASDTLSGKYPVIARLFELTFL